MKSIRDIPEERNDEILNEVRRIVSWHTRKWRMFNADIVDELIDKVDYKDDHELALTIFFMTRVMLENGFVPTSI